MKTLIKAIGRIEIAILLTCGIAATLIMFGNAIARYAFGTSFTWAEEVVRILFVWSMFLAITTGFVRGQHIGFLTIVDKHPILQHISSLFYGIILATVGLIVVVQGSRYNTLIGPVPLPGTNWPTSLFLLPGICSGVAWIGIGIHRFVSTLHKMITKPSSDSAKGV